MGSEHLGLLRDCKAPGRKYVLIRESTRWQHRRDRVVVQSPVLQIPAGVSQIPVKRYHGEDTNSVCFIPSSDIEKDSSGIYERELVSKDSGLVDAHGAAMFDGPEDGKFLYSKGDKFWIYKSPSTTGTGPHAPVINLRTCQSGLIAIDQVCWFPKVQGPNQEYWTLGGEIRKLKLCGKKLFTYWSWVISQKLDGTPTLTQDVRVPTREIPAVGTTLLSIDQAKDFFLEMQRIILKLQPAAPKQKPQLLRQPLWINTILLPPSPPDSPHIPAEEEPAQRAALNSAPAPPALPMEHRQARYVLTEETALPYISPCSTSGLSSPTSPRPSPLLPIVAIDSRNTLQRSRSPPQLDACRRIPETAPRKRPRRLGDRGTQPYKTRPYIALPRSTAPRFIHPLERSQLVIPELQALGPNDILCVSLLQGLNRPPPYEPAVNIQDQNIQNGSAPISDMYFANRPSHNIQMDARCDAGIRNCKYTTLTTSKHYHPDPNKCLFQEDDEHEHCIGRLRALPDGAGECLLANMPIRGEGHICCHWSEEDLKGVRVLFRRDYDAGKWRHAGRKWMRVFDVSSLCESAGNEATRMRLSDALMTDEGMRWLNDARGLTEDDFHKEEERVRRSEESEEGSITIDPCEEKRWKIDA